DEQVGINIIRRALEEPLRTIVENAGYEGAVLADQVKAADRNVGFNAEAERMEDLFQAGIIDPAMVVRCALQNAASVASLLLTTEAVITEARKEKDKDKPPGMGNGGGPYG